MSNSEKRLERVFEKLRQADREAALRGFPDTGFPRLWFSAIAREGWPDGRDTLRMTYGTTDEGSTPSRSSLVDCSPALAELRAINSELNAEIARLRLTDEEREAVEVADAYMSAAGCHNTNVQKTLRRLLERPGESNVLRDR